MSLLHELPPVRRFRLPFTPPRACFRLGGKVYEAVRDLECRDTREPLLLARREETPMPVITHRKGPHRHVLSYGPDEDLEGVCAAIVEMANRPELDLELDDLFALAEQVADQAAAAAREALEIARGRPPRPT